MKSIFYFIFLFSSLAFSQTNGITYQAVIYNPADPNGSYAPLTNQNVCLQFSVLASDGTTVEYQEQVNVSTDVFGMVNLLIGTNTQTGGTATDFDQIQWTSAAKSLKVELDINGNCSNFEELSNKPFNYVPFAYYSRNNVAGPQGPQGEIGLTGPSAYEIWLAAGNTGDESVFLEKIVGNGIASTTQSVSGTLTLTYDDGSTFTTSDLTGPQGNGIASTTESVSGTLTFTYDNGTTFTTSNLTGPQGEIGLTGPSAYQIWRDAGNSGVESVFLDKIVGNGIASTTQNVSGTLTFTFDDGSTFTTSDLTGPQGATGPQGPQGESGFITTSDGLILTGTGTDNDPYMITLPTGGTEGKILQIVNGSPSWANIIDSDNDGISDPLEGYNSDNPSASTDSDSDGVPDYLESNITDQDGDGTTDHLDDDNDTDGDGESNAYETANGSDPNDVASTSGPD